MDSVVDYGFESRSGQTKDYKIVIFSFSAHNKDKGVREKTGWREIKIMYSSGETVGMLFHWANTFNNPTNYKRVGLTQSGTHHYLIESNLFPPWYSW